MDFKNQIRDWFSVKSIDVQKFHLCTFRRRTNLRMDTFTCLIFGSSSRCRLTYAMALELEFVTKKIFSLLLQLKMLRALRFVNGLNNIFIDICWNLKNTRINCLRKFNDFFSLTFSFQNFACDKYLNIHRNSFLSQKSLVNLFST